ncbi:MAG: metallophosphoesterase [Bacteroidales bacterium]|nr:metallophosphoesterase [Bacteroidales bacterium]
MIIEYKSHLVFSFADTHGMYRRLFVPTEADILICAGDACEGFNPADLVDFFAWYAAIPAKLRIFVPGNHDRIFNTNPDGAKSLIPDGVVYLENEGLEFDGIKFYSVPARPYLKTPLAIPEDIDFLITHGPAYGYIDRGLGCKNLFLSMASARPKYHIFGHVHEEGLKRKAMLGSTTYLNVSYFEYLRYNLCSTR